MNNKDREAITARFPDLYQRSRDKGIYTYSGFLYEADAQSAYAVSQDRKAVTLYGGFPEAERVIVRFGRPEEIPWEEPFPIAVIEVSPVNEKFSDELSHRDFLGSLMNLGIERDVIGDIVIKEGKAWICVLDQMEEYICRELVRVKRTTVQAESVPEMPEYARPEKELVRINVASSRIDSVTARFCNCSRTKVSDLFRSGKILLNGIECHSEDKLLKEEDRITARGFGKFIYKGIEKETKKKREVVLIERYVR